MAGFRAHITTSTVLGAAYGGAAYALFGVPLPTCCFAGGLCSVSGMLPDVDSNSSRPLQEGLAFAAAVVPMMLVDRFEQFGMNAEAVVMAGVLVYLFVRFALGELLRRSTVHRGMFHSLPAAIIFGQVAFLLTSDPDLRLRLFKAGGVLIGYLSHLALDELYSIEWYRGRLRLKKSFGTALKVFSHTWWANISTYAKLGLLTYVVLYEPGWMEHVRQGRPLDWAQDWVEEQTETLADYPASETAGAPTENPDPGPVQGLFMGLDGDSNQDGSQNASSGGGGARTAGRPARLRR